MERIFHYTISSANAGETVGSFLRDTGYSRHVIAHLKRTDHGICVGGVPVYTNRVLNPGDELCVSLREGASSEHIPPVPMELDIVYEDDDLLVLCKPADMPIHPSQGNYDNTLANGVAWYYASRGETFVYRCINRLDRDTTGLLIIAKHMLSAAVLSQSLLRREIHRTYLALVQGIPSAEGTIDRPIGRVPGSTIERQIDEEHGERAVTHFLTLAQFSGYALIQLRLETGRTHQIRVHMASLGHPLLGDFLYNPRCTLMRRQALHSYRLEFPHPITGEALRFAAPPPKDMAQLLGNYSLPDFSSMGMTLPRSSST